MTDADRAAPFELEALFDIAPMPHKDALRIGVMWGKHGKRDGQICRECSHFVQRWTPAGKSHRKCELFGITCGPGTDWNGGFAACGQWRHHD